MAYADDNLGGPLYTGGAALPLRIFSYTSTEAMAAVAAANFFTNATKRGMEVGDLVVVRQVNSMTAPTTITTTLANVSAINAAGAGTVVALA